MTDRFDIIILGGGNAGFGVSALAAEAGKSIAFVEERDFGGTCPNRGCTPKKVLVAAGHALHEIETAKAHCIETGPATLDWAKLIDRTQALISHIPGAMAGVAAKRGTVFRGAARFVGPNAVEVDGQRLEADNIVIATGSTPRPLPIPGADLMITSDEVLTERTQPGEVVFIGGGVIAMEFSHVYARAGSKVTILEVMPQLLGNVDQDAVAAIRGESERVGIDIKTGVEVTRIEQADGRLGVVFRHDGAEHGVIADRVVNGAGRIANVAGLDLDAGGIKHDRIRIEVDEHLRSVSNPAVWVCGDALVGPPQLSPLATYEGRIVGRNIVEGATHKPDYSVVPSGIYTVPAMSSVGLTEAQAAAQGLDVTVAVNDMTGWFSGKTYAESVAWVKTLVERDSGRIVGAHMVGHQGEDLIHLFAMAMKHGITADQIKDQLFAFPTFSADLKSMI
jgi:glutathione reductase (NADPH)